MFCLQNIMFCRQNIMFCSLNASAGGGTRTAHTTARGGAATGAMRPPDKGGSPGGGTGTVHPRGQGRVSSGKRPRGTRAKTAEQYPDKGGLSARPERQKSDNHLWNPYTTHSPTTQPASSPRRRTTTSSQIWRERQRISTLPSS